MPVSWFCLIIFLYEEGEKINLLYLLLRNYREGLTSLPQSSLFPLIYTTVILLLKKTWNGTVFNVIEKILVFKFIVTVTSFVMYIPRSKWEIRSG